MELSEKYVSDGDGEKKAPSSPVKLPTRCQTDRPEDLPTGRAKKAKEEVPPQKQVTSKLRQKTKLKPYVTAMRARME